MQEVDIKTLHVKAGVRYWEDSTVDGIEDEEGKLIPCRKGDYWVPVIDMDKGQIINWKIGVKAEIHYKVCDDGEYIFKDDKGKTVLMKEGYVPNIMSPKENGYGDYIIMDIDMNGFIKEWYADIEDITDNNED